MIQIGTRNMQNFDLLKAVGQVSTPVILKRGMSATISEWLMAGEYIAAGGNHNIIFCERGIRTFETAYRNVLDVTAIAVMKRETHLPVIVDPSHAGGKAWMVPALSRAAVAAGRRRPADRDPSDAEGSVVRCRPGADTRRVRGADERPRCAGAGRGPRVLIGARPIRHGYNRSTSADGTAPALAPGLSRSDAVRRFALSFALLGMAAAFPVRAVMPSVPQAGLPSAIDYGATLLPERAGVVSWRTLAQVTPVKQGDRMVPEFSKDILALDKRDVKVQGFIIPLDMGDRQTRFLLAAVPPHCSFCMPAGPDAIVEVSQRGAAGTKVARTCRSQDTSAEVVDRRTPVSFQGPDATDGDNPEHAMNRRRFLSSHARGPGRGDRVRPSGARRAAAKVEKVDKIEKITKTPDEWRKILTPTQFAVLREEGTERPFTSPLNNEKRKGTFVCAGCDLPFFDSKTKYDSGTGWPSFYDVIPGPRRNDDRSQAHHGAHRVSLRALRRTSGPRVRRRTEAHGAALLQQRRRAEVRSRLSRAASADGASLRLPFASTRRARRDASPVRAPRRRARVRPL